MCILLEHLTIENYPIYEPEVEKSEKSESPFPSALDGDCYCTKNS